MTSKIDPFHDIRPYNDEEVIALIEKGRQGLLKLPTKKDRERFFHDEVYCGKNKFNVLEQYFSNIEHIIKP